MKKICLAAAILALASFSNIVLAQDDQPKDKQSEEIVIRNKGDKAMSLNVQINGDTILVNGKPLDEFTDSNVTINQRKMFIHGGGHAMGFGFGQDENMPHNFQGQWKHNGHPKPFLGVTTEKAGDGVKIINVLEGSAAEKAGLKEDDIITKVNDQSIDDPQNLSDVVVAQKPKDEVTVTYIRNGKTATTKAILGARPEDQPLAYSLQGPDMNQLFNGQPVPPSIDGNDDDMPEFNFDKPQDLSHDFDMPRPKKLGLKIQDTQDGTVKVIDVDDSSNAAKAGLQIGDIIAEIDGNKINNTDDAREQLHPQPGKKSYLIKVIRNGKEISFDVPVPRRLKTADL